MPTLVIATADGEELAKSVGAPFSTPEGAIQWFDEIGEKITNYNTLKAKWDESKHTDFEAGKKFAEAASELGKFEPAVETLEALIEAAGEDKAKAGEAHASLASLYVSRLQSEEDLDAATSHCEKANELLPAEGDARIDADIVYAQVLSYNEDTEGARKLCEKHYDNLLKAKDERVIDLANVYLGTEESEDETEVAKRGRKMYLALAAAFPKHERVWELKVYAAWYGLSSGATDEAKAELKDVVENGEGRWKDIAKQVLDGANEEGSEKDG